MTKSNSPSGKYERESFEILPTQENSARVGLFREDASRTSAIFISGGPRDSVAPKASKPESRMVPRLDVQGFESWNPHAPEDMPLPASDRQTLYKNP